MDLLIEGNTLAVEAGDFVAADFIKEVEQHIVTALKTLSGEWALDNSKGIDYPAGMRETALLENDIKKQISEVEGVISLGSLKVIFNKSDRTINVSSTIKTVYGDFLLDERLKV